MQILRPRAFYVVLALCLVVTAGCGDGIKIVPVTGTVTLDGKPLDRIMVEFWPESDGPRSIGETDTQGHFELKTEDGKQDGASVGSHKVTLKDSAMMGDIFLGRAAEEVDLAQGRKPRIAVKLGALETTTITQVVEAGKPNNFELQATKPKK